MSTSQRKSEAVTTHGQPQFVELPYPKIQLVIFSSWSKSVLSVFSSQCSHATESDLLNYELEDPSIDLLVVHVNKHNCQLCSVKLFI